MSQRGRTAAGTVQVGMAALVAALALGGCGSSRARAQTANTSPSPRTVADAPPPGEEPAPSPIVARGASQGAALGASVGLAKHVYDRETKGTKLRRETARIAHDPTLLSALARGDLAGAHEESEAQLFGPQNHLDHVTRISVVRGAKVLVNATINPDGVYVVAPARRELVVHGRRVGTLLVSLQDVTGFVKLVHHLTGDEVLARGSSGHVRASLPAAIKVHLPSFGQVTVAGHRYAVRSFHELGWGGEPITVWILR